MTKYIFVFAFSILALASCQTDIKEKTVEEIEASIPKKPNERKEISQVPKDTVNVGKLEFEDGLVYDFGTVQEGDNVTHTFKFKNIGKVPLVIKNAVGSCGCTVPEFNREPIDVGGTSEIQVKFNSKGRSGSQKKTVTIIANTNPTTTVLQIKGTVKKKS